MKAIKDIFASNPQRTPHTHTAPLHRELATPFRPPLNKNPTKPPQKKNRPSTLPSPSPTNQTVPSIPQPLGQTRPDQFFWGLFGLVMNNGWPSPLWLSTTAAPLNWPWHRAIHWLVWMAAWLAGWPATNPRDLCDDCNIGKAWTQY